MNIALCSCGTTKPTKVYVTKAIVINEIDTVKRGRECPTCGRRWPTVEVPLALGREVLEDE